MLSNLTSQLTNKTPDNWKWLKNIRVCFLDILFFLKIEHTSVFNYGEFLC